MRHRDGGDGHRGCAARNEVYLLAQIDLLLGLAVVRLGRHDGRVCDVAMYVFARLSVGESAAIESAGDESNGERQRVSDLDVYG